MEEENMNVILKSGDKMELAENSTAMAAAQAISEALVPFILFPYFSLSLNFS